MVKNLIGGNKAKSMSSSRSKGSKLKLFKPPNYSDGDIIGKVIKDLGSGRFDTKCYLNGTILNINCSVPKKIRLLPNDIVMVNILRDNKKTYVLGNIFHKYDPSHYPELKAFDSDYIKSNRLTRPDIMRILKTETLQPGESDISDLFCYTAETKESPEETFFDATDCDIEDI